MATRSTDGQNPAWRGNFGQKKGPGDYPSPWIGGAREDRTPDLVIANDALSQLSYGPNVSRPDRDFGLQRTGPGRAPKRRTPDPATTPRDVQSLKAVCGPVNARTHWGR